MPHILKVYRDGFDYIDLLSVEVWEGSDIRLKFNHNKNGWSVYKRKVSGKATTNDPLRCSQFRDTGIVIPDHWRG